MIVPGQKHNAYVLKAGETDAPAGLKKALPNANAMQDIAMREIRPARAGNDSKASSARTPVQ